MWFVQFYRSTIGKKVIMAVTGLIGVGFAVLGGLLAGAVGGWRAARLAPAEALRNVG